MRTSPRPALRPVYAWYGASLLWSVVVGLMGLLILFRAMKTSGIAQAFQFDDVPMLRFFDLNFGKVFWLTALLGIAFVTGVVLWSWWTEQRAGSPTRAGFSGLPARFSNVLTFTCATSLFVVLGLIASRYHYVRAAGPEINATGLLDWLAVASLAVAAAVMPSAMGRLMPSPDGVEALRDPEQPCRLTRFALTYLLSCASVVVYAVLEHLRFWDPDRNGGFNYRQFFLEQEITQANLVFVSTSLVFATLAALVGCAILPIVRRAAGTFGGGPAMPAASTGRLALVLSLAWSVSLMVPWEIKILPEIIAEKGWILPAVAITLTTAALIPLFHLTLVALKHDFDWLATKRLGGSLEGKTANLAPPFYPRRSEFALLAFLLFPIYPWLRPLRSAGGTALHAVLAVWSAAVLGALIWVVNKADLLFDFDDWRGMMHAGQFPFLQVMLSLLAAYWVYLYARRAVEAAIYRVRRARGHNDPANEPMRVLPLRIARPVCIAAAVGTLGLASWPFWGWSNVRENVFARAVEYNDRHEFEIRFLHWLFDLDRDGYAAVLHGADHDDFNPQIQAGGAEAPEQVPVHIDEFEVVDRQKALAFPNVLVFFLEGVTPRTISQYGYRRLPGGRSATPHMDSIAAEGTLFKQARCFYPSTWDAWLATFSGRFLRIKEMDASRPFYDRYCRYNNLYKILKLAGVNRWCHGDVDPFHDLLVHYDLRGAEATDWGVYQDGSKEFDTTVSAEEEDRGVWRGDKRNERILAFINSLEAGDKFFIAEHMSDTHFPWRRTTRKRATKLGFVEGLDLYERDAVLPCGGTDDKYSRYFQTITRMDGQIGQILRALKRKPALRPSVTGATSLYDETMVVIVSDHGCQWWEHEHMYYVSHIYEQCLIVPLIIKIPGIPGGRVCNQPVMQFDVLPTAVELAGARHTNPDPEYPLTCRSLLPLMRGDNSPATARRFRERDLILCTHYDMLGVMHNFRYKLIFDRPVGTYLLFDLKNDAAEMHNLADERPELLEEMLGRLRKLIRRHKSFIGSITPSGMGP